MRFTSSPVCSSRSHCASCRGDKNFRVSLQTIYEIPKVDFGCPHGVPWNCSIHGECPENSGKVIVSDLLGLGDFVEKLLSFFGIRKKSLCGCTERKNFLNSVFPLSSLRVIMCIVSSFLIWRIWNG